MDWKPDSPPPIAVAAGANIKPIQPLSSNTEPGDTPYHLDRRNVAPTIAVDPGDNQLVYVTFCARRERFDESPPDRNADIHISRSTDGGTTFPGANVVQLTDEMLGITNATASGPDQVMPAMIVDGCGGVNLVFYENRNPDNLPPPVSGGDRWDVWYVRITNFGPNPAIYRKRLTSESFPLPTVSFLGDYHHKTTAGPDHRTLYIAYTRLRQVDGQWDDYNQSCYLNKSRIYCLSDLDNSGVSDATDVALFNAAFDAGTSDSSGGGGGDADLAQMADLNEDGVVDLDDFDLFWNQYLNGCGGGGGGRDGNGDCGRDLIRAATARPGHAVSGVCAGNGFNCARSLSPANRIQRTGETPTIRTRRAQRRASWPPTDPVFGAPGSEAGTAPRSTELNPCIRTAAWRSASAAEGRHSPAAPAR